MKLEILSKKEAKNAELETTPVSNLAFTTMKKMTTKQKELQSLISEMFNWQYTKEHEVRAGLETTIKKKDHISKILGKPLYHANYEYREAVWGFKAETYDVICYYSTKGFSVQMSKDCPHNVACDILRTICNKLKNNSKK